MTKKHLRLANWAIAICLLCLPACKNSLPKLDDKLVIGEWESEFQYFIFKDALNYLGYATASPSEVIHCNESVEFYNDHHYAQTIVCGDLKIDHKDEWSIDDLGGEKVVKMNSALDLFAGADLARMKLSFPEKMYHPDYADMWNSVKIIYTLNGFADRKYLFLSLSRNTGKPILRRGVLTPEFPTTPLAKK
jgi:hypothetical protein